MKTTTTTPNSSHDALTSSMTVNEDVLLHVMCFLTYRDTLRMSGLCRKFRYIASTKQLWLHILKRDVISEHLPLPTSIRPIELLTASQTKSLVINSLKVQRAALVPQEHWKPLLASFHQALQVSWIRLIDARWLLVAFCDRSISSLALFPVQAILRGEPPVPVSQVFLGAAVSNGRVEILQDRSVIIVLELRGTIPAFEILSLNAIDQEIMFIRLARYRGVAHLRALSGPLIGYALHADVSIPSVLNWKTGAVTHLCSVPDVHGSAVAMAIGGCLVALLNPVQLQIMRLQEDDGTEEYQTISTFDINCDVGHAQVSFVFASGGLSVSDSDQPQEGHLRVCISNHKGVFAYSIGASNFMGRHNDLAKFLVWSHLFSESSFCPGGDVFPAHPLFGRACTTVSWLETCSESTSLVTPVYFTTMARGLIQEGIPDPSSVRVASRYEAHEAGLPAMHAMSVRDYDDELGLLAVGNAFGELALYSIGGTTLEELDDILQPVHFPPPSDVSDIISKTCIHAQSAMPYPSTLVYRSDNIEWEDVAELWFAHQPPALPIGWNGPNPAMAADFSGKLGSIGWRLENAWHFLGRPIPIARRCDDILLKAGRLFLVINLEADVVSVINPELNPTRILDAFSIQPFTLNLLGVEAFRTTGERAMHQHGLLVDYYRVDELKRRGIDRLRLLRERGGGTDESRQVQGMH